MTDQKSTERKATDVLISIEKKLDDVLSYQKNQDLLIKRLAQQLFDVQKQLLSGQSSSSPKQEVAINEANAPLTIPASPKALPGIKPGVRVGEFVGANPAETKPTDFVDVDSQLEQTPPNVDFKEQLKKRGTRTVNQNKNATVKQNLKYPDGRPLAMAKVDIFDIDKNNLISSVKSSVMGEWVETLPADKYIVAISKRAAGDKPEVSTEFILEVPSSSAPLKLDDLIVPST
jgi:hypothetical protein